LRRFKNVVRDEGQMTTENPYDYDQALEDIRKTDPFGYVVIQSADGCLLLGAVIFLIGIVSLALGLEIR